MDIPWIWILVSFAAAAIVGVLRARRKRRFHEAELENRDRQLAEQRTESSQRASAQEHNHRIALERVGAEHVESLARTESRREDAELRAQIFRSELSKQFSTDLVSRRLIRDACLVGGIDALLATNLRFIPAGLQGGVQFAVQIDHVLVTDRGTLIVENKYWRGIVYDNVKPATDPVVAALMPRGSDPTEEVGLHIPSGKVGEGIVGRYIYAHDRPRAQVRRQAAQLHEFVKSHLGREYWFDTCVLYSHPDAIVRHGAERAATPTLIIPDPASAAKQIRTWYSNARGGDKRPTATQIAPVLEQLGADLVGVGAFAQRWKSEVPFDLGPRG